MEKISARKKKMDKNQEIEFRLNCIIESLSNVLEEAEEVLTMLEIENEKKERGNIKEN